MPFKFRHLCDLLQSLDGNRIKKKATCAQAKNSDAPIIISWFNKHSREIPRHGIDAVAFLSSLFPERRADRCYNIQEKGLEKIVGRSLLLSTTRLRHLASWRTANGAEFAQTVQNVMAEAEFDRPRPEHEVTLEEVDALFDRIAAAYSGSSPDLRARVTDPVAADEALSSLFRRLQSVEAKWLIRMFLKRYTPVELPEMLVMRQFHCLLPEILRLQNCFAAAVRCLDDPSVSHLCPRPRNKEQEQAIKLEAAPHLKPEVGIMVQRAPYWKARSIQHCCDMAGRRRISVERKYDGEYCQVHVDTSKGKHSIKIFSKRGKDSTDDRVRLHGAITDALKLGKKVCPIKKQCILEGELLIWHEKEQQIQHFDKIRKHVSRNGRFLGNDQDSPRDHHERLMIMFYDVLLHDDIFCLNEPLEQRRSRLRSLVRRLPGQAELGSREKINFASSDAKAMIRRAFAKCISRGWEGFILKGCDDPYFSLAGSPHCIKLKKDYITGLGDIVDLAIIGGRRDVREEQALNIGRLNWTTFYLGCLENREEVHRFAAARPRFRIVGVVSAAKQTISPERTCFLNDRGQFESIPYAPLGTEMEVIMDQCLDPPTELFKNPFIVEVVGGGFDKPANVRYHTLRFPRIVKIHEDRSYSDIMSFDGLQTLAEKVQSIAENEDSQGDREWIEKLIRTDPKSKFIDENSASTSVERKLGSASTATPPSSAHAHSMSPLLVRIDMQDMTEQERDARPLNGGEDRISALPQARTHPSTRKRKSHEDSPDEATPAKIPKLSKQHTASEDSNGLLVKRLALPSCNQLRKPLRHIQNSSAAAKIPSGETQPPDQMQPCESQQYSTPHCPRSREEKSILAVVLRHPKAISRQIAFAHQIESIRHEIPLPTPPTSSAEEVRDDNFRNAREQPTSNAGCELRKESKGNFRPGTVRLSPSLEAADSRQMPPHFNFLRSWSSVIFLSSAVTMAIARDKPELLSNLSDVESSFTMSRKFFLDDMQRVSGKSHIAIVSVADPEDAGHEVGTFHEAILKQVKYSQPAEGRLLFFDWKVLQYLSSEMLSAPKLKPYFGGCLLWRSDVDATAQPTLEVRDVWKWEKVVEALR
jgi:DNA ligase 4